MNSLRDALMPDRTGHPCRTFDTKHVARQVVVEPLLDQSVIWAKHDVFTGPEPDAIREIFGYPELSVLETRSDLREQNVAVREVRVAARDLRKRPRLSRPGKLGVDAQVFHGKKRHDTIHRDPFTGFSLRRPNLAHSAQS